MRMMKDLSKLDETKLHPLSPKVISRQATINIGTIDHVEHGKSTVVKTIFAVQTVRFKNELERNITIKLRYANAKIYKCEDERCPRPMCYKVYGSGKEDAPVCDVLEFENSRMKLLRHVSFVDCPIEALGLPLSPESLATLKPFTSITFNAGESNGENSKPEVAKTGLTAVVAALLSYLGVVHH